MTNQSAGWISPAVIVRRATFQDVRGVLDLKGRIKGISLPWGESELTAQISRFPEGQYVAVNARTKQVIGALGTLVIVRSEYPLSAKWSELTAEGSFRNHDPVHGKTLFRSHLIVDPQFDDGRKMRDLLSEAELEIAARFGLERIRVGLRFKDYYLFHHLAPAAYFHEIEQGLIGDSWVTQTLMRGFKALALVAAYYPKDWRSDGYAVVAQLDLHPIENEHLSAEHHQIRPHLTPSAAA